MQKNSSFESTGGRLSAGVNYWASHAGTAMWKDWRPDVVEKDFAVLAGYGTTVVRVFPLWPDFQPVSALRSGTGVLREYCTAGKRSWRRIPTAWIRRCWSVFRSWPTSRRNII